MNDTQYKRYLATARSKRRAVVGIVIATVIILLLLIQWARTGSVSDNGNVGGGTELADGVLAVVSLYDNTKDDPFIDRVKAHMLVDRGVRTIALMEDGRVVSVDDGDRASVITATTRPQGWFLPLTVGVLHVREGNSIKAYRISTTSGKLRVTAGASTHMTSTMPQNVVTGAHIECKRDCEDIGIAGIDLNVPGNIQNFDFITTNDENETKFLFTFNKNVPSDDVEQFAKDLASFASPIHQERQLESGVVITEIIPNSNVTETSMSSINATAFGDDEKLVYFAKTDDRSYISTSRTLIEEAINGLSTPAWTNKICGQVPSLFMPVSFSATFTENTSSPFYIVRTNNEWIVCEKS